VLLRREFAQEAEPARVLLAHFSCFNLQYHLLMQLLHVQRSRMYASAALGAKGAKVRVLIQPKGAKTASTQPYMVWLLAASGRDQGVNSDGKIAGGCKSSRHRKCCCW